MLQEQEAELQKVKFNQIYVRPASPYTGCLIFASGKYSCYCISQRKILEQGAQGAFPGSSPRRAEAGLELRSPAP